MAKRYRLDEQHKIILDSNRYLLVKNIIQTPDLQTRLVSDKVITQTMLRDVQDGKSQEDKNDRLVNVLKLRNRNAFRKFVYALMFTGHSLLADFLHDEEQTGARYVTAAEIERRIPSVATCLGLDDMKRLCHYIESKIKGEIAKKMWNDSTRERDRVEEVRKELFFKETEKQKLLEKTEQKASDLQMLLQQAGKEKADKDQQIKDLKSTMAQMETDHKNTLAKQIRFNAANNSTILKMSDRLIQYSGHITELTNKLQRSVSDIFADHGDDDYLYRYGPRAGVDYSRGKTDDKRKLSELDSVVSRLLQAAQSFNEDLKQLDSNSAREREIVLTMLESREKQITTSEALKLFIDRENKEKEHFLRDIQSISSVLNNDKLSAQTSESKNSGNISQATASQTSVEIRNLRSSLGMLREEIQHMAKRVQWKEAQIRALEEENAGLKTGFFIKSGRINAGPQRESSVGQFPNSTSPPLKLKNAGKSRFTTNKKTKGNLSTRRKQRVLSPIEETTPNKSANIIFPALEKNSDTTKTITNIA